MILRHKNKLFYIMYKLKILECLHILVDFNSIDLTPRMPLSSGLDMSSRQLARLMC